MLDTGSFKNTMNTKFKEQLNPALKNIYKKMRDVCSEGVDAETGDMRGIVYDETWLADQLSTEFAKIISDIVSQAAETWIKTGTVKVTAPTGGITVAGSPTTQTNSAPITIEGDPKNPLALGGIQ